jgi:hypothetical protein
VCNVFAECTAQGRTEADDVAIAEVERYLRVDLCRVVAQLHGVRQEGRRNLSLVLTHHVAARRRGTEHCAVWEAVERETRLRCSSSCARRAHAQQACDSGLRKGGAR